MIIRMKTTKRIQLPQKKKLFRPPIMGIVIIHNFIPVLYRLNNWPSVWWDEGWTLDAARNWIEHGHLGHYMDGIPIPARPLVRFVVAVMVALSMKIFGIGVWQGRLPGVIFTILSLVLLVYLTSTIYNRKLVLLRC